MITDAFVRQFIHENFSTQAGYWLDKWGTYVAKHSNAVGQQWKITHFNNSEYTTVRRYDGTVFSIGDMTMNGTINGFDIRGDTLYAELANGSVQDVMELRKIVVTGKKNVDDINVNVGDHVEFEIYIDGKRKETITGKVVKTMYARRRAEVAYFNRSALDWKTIILSFDELRPAKKELFITDDGITIHDDLFIVWVVDTSLGFNMKSLQALGCRPEYNPHHKYFSTKEAAKQYIKANKPVNISMKELASCITNYVRQSGDPFLRAKQSTTMLDVEKLEKLIESKL